MIDRPPPPAAPKSDHRSDRPCHPKWLVRPTVCRNWSGNHHRRRPQNSAQVVKVSDQGSLRRRRDFARQRWPCGQHKIAVWRLAPTAAPRIPCVNLPMAAPFGLGSRRGICVYHRRCGTTSSARLVPLGPHSDEDLRWRPGAPQACHFASVIANNLSIGNPQAARTAMARPGRSSQAVSEGRRARSRVSVDQRWPQSVHCKWTSCPCCSGGTANAWHNSWCCGAHCQLEVVWTFR